MVRARAFLVQERHPIRKTALRRALYESLDIRQPEDVDAAFDKALAFGAKGLVNAVDTFINSRRFVLAAGGAKYKFPFAYSDVEYVFAGGLLALGPGHYEGYHRAAKYVDEILRGANPVDMPIADRHNSP